MSGSHSVGDRSFQAWEEAEPAPAGKAEPVQPGMPDRSAADRAGRLRVVRRRPVG